MTEGEEGGERVTEGEEGGERVTEGEREGEREEKGRVEREIIMATNILRSVTVTCIDNKGVVKPYKNDLTLYTLPNQH